MPEPPDDAQPKKPEDRAELPTDAAAPGELPGRRLGPYRLLEKAGEGGMGEVWLAEQSEPIQRTVALKVIKQGMDTRQVVARFEAERQALALMDHPAIAKVYDAGATPHGRPYFVMEYVPGIPINQYCDRHRLTTSQRIDLFAMVCEGVQHAHQKAVIHRDLKPSNVLISERNGVPEPKIIDFGVAKATAHKLTDRTLHTQLGAILGTPSYMSPEQADMTSHDVDTRSDVYSLGVMLYELLVGALPFDPKELQEAGLEAMMRKIREEDPPRPSARLNSLGEATVEVVSKRRTQLQHLRRSLRGDLDWITMKALEKDRTRRYDSPQHLAADLQRFQNDEPVQARPPSSVYRVKKFVRRHTGGVLVAATGLITLVAFAVTMTVQAGRIARERDRANMEAEAKGQVSDFLVNLFNVSDPSEARGNTITARELLDEGSAEIRSMLIEQPEIRAELMITMGNVYRKLGLYSQAEPLLEDALNERRMILGEDHPKTLSTLNLLAVLYVNQGRYDEAETIYEKSLEAKRRIMGPEHPNTLNSMNDLANIYETLGRYDEAEPLYLETLAARERVLGADHHHTLSSMNNLGRLYAVQGRYDEAEPRVLEVVEAKKRILGEDHPDTLTSMNSLADLYKDQGREAEAEPIFVKTLEIRRKVLGDDHPDTLHSMNNLANLYAGQGRYDEAEGMYLASLEAKRRVLGGDHRDTLSALNNLASLYKIQGRHDEALDLNLEALEAKRRVLGPEHPDTLSSMNNRANLFLNLGRYAEAEQLYAETLDAKRRVFGPDHPNTLRSMSNLANLYKEQGRNERAEPIYLETLAKQRKLLGENHISTAITQHNIACLFRDTGREAEARALFETVHRFCLASLRPGHAFFAANVEEFALLLRKTGDDATALKIEAEAKAAKPARKS